MENCATNQSGVQLKPELVTLSKSTFVFALCLGISVFLLSLVCLIFNFLLRHNRVIKMSSPRLNMVIACGGILASVCCVLEGTHYFLTVDSYASQMLCHVQQCVLCVSFSLVYGPMIGRTWRVNRIFKLAGSQRVVIRDKKMMMMTSLLVLLDMLGVAGWWVFDPMTFGYIGLIDKITSDLDPSNPVKVAVIPSCKSKWPALWSAYLVAHKLPLLLVGLKESWWTHGVLLPAINDAKPLAVSLLVTVAMATAAAVTSSAFQASPDVAKCCVAGCVWLASVSAVSAVLVPKLLLWRRSPKGPVSRVSISSTSSSKAVLQSFEQMEAELNSANAKIDNLKDFLKQKETSIEKLRGLLSDAETNLSQMNLESVMAATSADQSNCPIDDNTRWLHQENQDGLQSLKDDVFISASSIKKDNNINNINNNNINNNCKHQRHHNTRNMNDLASHNNNIVKHNNLFNHNNVITNHHPNHNHIYHQNPPRHIHDLRLQTRRLSLPSTTSATSTSPITRQQFIATNELIAQRHPDFCLSNHSNGGDNRGVSIRGSRDAIHRHDDIENHLASNNNFGAMTQYPMNRLNREITSMENNNSCEYINYTNGNNDILDSSCHVRGSHGVLARDEVEDGYFKTIRAKNGVEVVIDNDQMMTMQTTTTNQHRRDNNDDKSSYDNRRRYYHRQEGSMATTEPLGVPVVVVDATNVSDPSFLSPTSAYYPGQERRHSRHSVTSTASLSKLGRLRCDLNDALQLSVSLGSGWSADLDKMARYRRQVKMARRARRKSLPGVHNITESIMASYDFRRTADNQSFISDCISQSETTSSEATLTFSNRSLPVNLNKISYRRRSSSSTCNHFFPYNQNGTMDGMNILQDNNIILPAMLVNSPATSQSRDVFYDVRDGNHVVTSGRISPAAFYNPQTSAEVLLHPNQADRYAHPYANSTVEHYSMAGNRIPTLTNDSLYPESDRSRRLSGETEGSRGGRSSKGSVNGREEHVVYKRKDRSREHSGVNNSNEIKGVFAYDRKSTNGHTVIPSVLATRGMSYKGNTVKFADLDLDKEEDDLSLQTAASSSKRSFVNAPYYRQTSEPVRRMDCSVNEHAPSVRPSQFLNPPHGVLATRGRNDVRNPMPTYPTVSLCPPPSPQQQQQQQGERMKIYNVHNYRPELSIVAKDTPNYDCLLMNSPHPPLQYRYLLGDRVADLNIDISLNSRDSRDRQVNLEEHTDV